MGEVYRARDTRLGRDVAVKILSTLLSSDPDLKLRFEREARAVSLLTHPNICCLYDIGSQDGTDFIVMEYLEGETLAVRLSAGPLPFPLSLKIGVEIADALDKAHCEGCCCCKVQMSNSLQSRNVRSRRAVGMCEITALGDFQGLWEAWDSFIVPRFPSGRHFHRF
jgi:serine/threonine protein kinase